jgi:hypothetical protein
MARTLMSLRRGGKRLTTEQGVVPHFGLGEGVEMAPIRCAKTSASREKRLLRKWPSTLPRALASRSLFLCRRTGGRLPQ